MICLQCRASTAPAAPAEAAQGVRWLPSAEVPTFRLLRRDELTASLYFTILPVTRPPAPPRSVNVKEGLLCQRRQVCLHFLRDSARFSGSSGLCRRQGNLVGLFRVAAGLVVVACCRGAAMTTIVGDQVRGATGAALCWLDVETGKSPQQGLTERLPEAAGG